MKTESGANLRNWWLFATQPLKENHYASYPEELVRKCVMLTTSERGVCAKCGAQWERVVEKSTKFESGSGKAGNKPRGKYDGAEQSESGSYDIRMGPVNKIKTLGWQPTCTCNAPIAPATVLDPFSGAATTGLVALKLGRRYTGIELNPEYNAMALKRIAEEANQMKLAL